MIRYIRIRLIVFGPDGKPMPPVEGRLDLPPGAVAEAFELWDPLDRPIVRLPIDQHAPGNRYHTICNRITGDVERIDL